jgi:PiT family inorganic phosphate transporter
MMALLIVFISLTLIYGFLNGFHDASNIVSTIIFSRAMRPTLALGLVALAEFGGPFIFGVAVARTIGSNFLVTGSVGLAALAAAMISAVAWNLATWYLGTPSSSSHALIGGLLGATLVSAGYSVILPGGLIIILAALFLAPIIGLLAGHLVTKLVFLLTRKAPLKVNWFFKNAQVVTGTVLALSQGANDAPKSMGVILLGLVAYGASATMSIPHWVILACAGALGLGTALGGWRLIRTVGARYYKIYPVDGFCSQLTAGIVLLVASLVGGPASTTQVANSAVMGVGSAYRLSKVRWTVARQIILAWLLTIPVTALIAAGVYLVFHLFGL